MNDIDWQVKRLLSAIENPDSEITVENIAKKLGKSDRTIQTKIKNLGWKWHPKLRKYDYIGEEPEPKDIDFRSLFDRNRTAKDKKNTLKEMDNIKASIHEKEVPTAASNKEYDIIDILLESKPKTKKVYKGFYIDEDVSAIIDSVGEGKKSELVNQALRKVFSEKGLL